MYSCIKLLWLKPTQFDLVTLILSHTQRELFLCPKITGEGGGRCPSGSPALPWLKEHHGCSRQESPDGFFLPHSAEGDGDFGNKIPFCGLGSASWEDLETQRFGLGAGENRAGFQPQIPAPRSSFGSNCPVQSIRRGHSRQLCEVEKNEFLIYI